MHGWLPWTIQAIAVTVLVIAIGWRSRRWRLIWLPAAAAVGAVLTGTAHWFVTAQGLAGDPAPKVLWVWIAVTGIATVVLVVRGATPVGGGAARQWPPPRCACCAQR